jgi:SAM-dependent methyltransferase
LLGNVKSRLPASWRSRLVRLRRPRSLYLLLRRLKPLSEYAGRERGQPIDRVYVESFLAAHAADVRGNVLEVKDHLYTTRFGGGNVKRSDVLDINTDNAQATIYADLRRLDTIASDTYDCFILTQTLQYVDDLEAAVKECWRILKPGGVLLVTLPCLGKVEGLEKNVVGNFWRFTPHAARYLFGKVFGEANVEVEARGNVLAGLAFWVGMAGEELSLKQLEHQDPAFPVVVTVRGRKGT